MAAKPLPAQELLRQLFRYESDSGLLYWKQCDLVPRTNARKVGSRAFSYQTNKGYFRGGLLGRKVMAHRVVWKLHYGTEPHEIDHINGNAGDNRIENLRAATRQENVRNTAIRITNMSGVQGVYWHKGKSRWIANIRTGGKQVELGAFKTLQSAAQARAIAEIKHGYHPNHGRKASA